MSLQRAHRPPSPSQPGSVSYRQQFVRCGKPSCRKCPPHGSGHGPYWYGFYWHYRQRTTSFYVGKHLPEGAVVLPDAPDPPPAATTRPTPPEGGDASSTAAP